MFSLVISCKYRSHKKEPGVHFTLMEEGGQLGLQWIMSNGGSAGLDGEIMSKLGLEVMPG